MAAPSWNKVQAVLALLRFTMAPPSSLITLVNVNTKLPLISPPHPPVKQ
jgi:hypothetical protein